MSDNPAKVAGFVDQLVTVTVGTPSRKLMTGALVASIAFLIKNKSQKKKDQAEDEEGAKQKRGGKGNVDHIFYERIVKLIKIVIPRSTCKEVIYLVTLTALLVLRTIMSIWLAEVNGEIVKSIVGRDLTEFIKRIFKLMLFAIPSSAVNSALEYFSKCLALSFRQRLTNYFHDKYL